MKCVRQRLALVTSLLVLMGSICVAQSQPSVDSVSSTPALSLDVARLRRGSRSHITLAGPGGPAEVFLFAADEKSAILNASYCGGDEGAKSFSGEYQLISLRNHRILSSVSLGQDAMFVEGRPHDGLREFWDQKTDEELAVVFQYRSCNVESVEFFRANADGKLHRVSFLDKDGREFTSRSTGPDGAMPRSKDGATLFCSYDNAIGYDLCDAYAYNGKDFVQTASWMTPDLGAGTKGRTASAEARRALFDFLCALARQDYRTAAGYYEGDFGSNSQARENTDRAAPPALLKTYCTTQGGQCLTPEQIEDQAPASADSMQFSVGFITADLKDFQMGGRTSFTFRVKRTAGGFKVLDLPPGNP